MERQRESKYRVETTSHPNLHNQYGQDELRTPGTKPSIVQINMVNNNNLNLHTIQPGQSASRISRPSSLSRSKVQASQTSSKQKRIEQVAMNHQNMRRMLNDERESSTANYGEILGDLSQHQAAGHSNQQFQDVQVLTNNSGSTVNEKNINLNFYQQSRSRPNLKKPAGANARNQALEEDGSIGAGDLLKTEESMKA